MCKQLKPAIVFLMETRARESTIKKLKKRLHFENVFYIEPRGLSGGLCLLWNEIYNVDIYFWCENHIKTRIDDRKGKIWECNFIYGNPCFGRRKEQWRAITRNNSNRGEPQVFIGDFNDILSQEEKIGLHPKPQSQVREFRQFVDMNYLMDLDIKGGRFTGFGNPRNGVITREKIDRALVNWEWRALYPQASLKALPAISSDHRPLILNMNQIQRKEKNFKFEAFWTDHEECENIVRKGWEKEDIQGRQLLKENAKWSIGNGARVSIWKDNWITGRSKPLNSNSTNDFRVKDLIVEGEGWDRRKIESNFPQEICKEILSTPISVMNKEDILYWPWREDGNYSIKTGYYAARRTEQSDNHRNPSTSEDKREIWREVWRMEVPQKIRMFLWKACQDILPVGSNLYKRKIASDPKCQICLKSPETVEHALLLCDWARATWFGAEGQWTPTVKTVTSIGNWIVECIKKLRAGGGENQERGISKLGFLMWEIWKTRNNKMFQQQEVNPRGTICRAKILEAIYWKLADTQQPNKKEGNHSKTNLVKWRPPPSNWLKANVDAAFRKETGTGAIAVVIRDYKGRIILGFSGKIQTKSSIAAEAQAIRNGNRLAHAVTKAAEADTLRANWSINPPEDIQNIIRKEMHQ
ncbi:hypothetical protein Ahy_A05g022025 [Arachis hypogaea]|uniref:Reverse transcriptase zinc-binding domain-containing protein n=1 Tax=Arachis hypogaea TaxID=3818 RepID=A0A445CZL3_ARAHY|nr:hypothetical protein Ahy_A05g022025 [Arachis hypogaea]